MRPIWKGSVTFGLVNVPVRMYTATEDHDVELHQVHAIDGGRIRYQRTCEVCGQVVSQQDMAKAYDDGERRVTLSSDELASVPVARSHEIEVVEFVPREQLDPIRFEKSYFLEPAANSPKAYVLLRQVLETTDRTAIVRMTLRTRTRLAALRSYGDVLTLHTLLWDDEVREAHFPALDQQIQVSDQEMAMSATLVESLADDFHPEQFTDDYQAQLRAMIDAKLESGEAVPVPVGDTADSGGEVLDLMEALRRSVEQATGKANDAAESRAESEKPAAKPRRKRAG